MPLSTALIEELEHAPQLLEAALRHVPAERLTWKPASWSGSPAENFSAIGHVCHLRDIETDGYHVRFRRLLGEEGPDLASLDGYALEAARRYQDADLGAALKAFREARFATVKTLSALSDAQLARRGIFAEHGAVTVHALAHLLRSHDQQHLAGLAWLAAKIASPTSPVAESAVDDRAAIERAIASFANAYNSGDVDAIAAYYGDDLVKMRQGTKAESRDEVAARIRAAFGSHRGRVEVDNQEIEVQGDMAYTRGTFTVTLTSREDGGAGQSLSLTRRYLEIWRKRDGGWQVVRAIDNAEA